MLEAGQGNGHVVEVIYAAVAIIGGAVKHLNEMVTKKEPLRPILFVSRTFISGFSGWIFAHASLLVATNPDFTVVAAGVGGYVGIEAIEMVKNYVVRKLNIS